MSLWKFLSSKICLSKKIAFGKILTTLLGKFLTTKQLPLWKIPNHQTINFMPLWKIPIHQPFTNKFPKFLYVHMNILCKIPIHQKILWKITIHQKISLRKISNHQTNYLCPFGKFPFTKKFPFEKFLSTKNIEILIHQKLDPWKIPNHMKQFMPLLKIPLHPFGKFLSIKKNPLENSYPPKKLPL